MKVKGHNVCKLHKRVISDISANISVRNEALDRKFAIYDGEKIFFTESNVKGSWGYANRISKKIAHLAPTPWNTHNFFLTLTWGKRDVCSFCSWKFIMNDWRSFRQNWQNYGFPQINSYVGVLEPHKDWFPHLHFYLNLGKYLQKKQMSKLHDVWGSRIDFEKAKNPKGYIFKYLTKGLKNLEFISLLSVLNGRQYFASRNAFQKQSETKEKIYHFLGETDFTKTAYNHYRIVYDWSGINDYDSELSNWDHISGANGFDLFGKFNDKLTVDEQIVESY